MSYFKNLSIQFKIILAVAIVLMISLGTIMFGVIKYQEQRDYKRIFNSMELYYQTIWHANEKLMEEGDMDIISYNFKNIVKNREILDVVLTDTNGKIKYSGFETEIGNRFPYYNPNVPNVKKEVTFKNKPAIIISKILYNSKKCVECHDKVALNKPLGAMAIVKDISSFKEALYKNKVMLSVIAWVLVFIIGILMNILLRIIVVKPLNDVNERLEVIAAGGGDLLQRIEIKSNDELGKLGKNFNTFLEKLKNVVQNVINSTIKSGKSIQHVLKLSLPVNELIKEESQKIEETGKVLENLHNSLNNLKERGDALISTAENLKNSNNDMIKAIEGIDAISGKVKNEIEMNVSSVEELIYSIKNVDNVTKHIKDFIDESNERFADFVNSVISVMGEIGTISNHIEKISDNVENLFEGFNSVAKDVQNTGEIAKKSAENADTGRGKIKELVEQMVQLEDTFVNVSGTIEGLSKMADSISEIIDVINEISDQTNLLALNAAIEAARAGEHGKGFAVVADEVRRLAERTANSTKEIERLIKQILNETENAVTAVNEGKEIMTAGVHIAENSSAAMDDIFNGANDTLNLVMQVVKATELQRSATEDIYRLVKTSSEIAEQVSNTTQNSSEEAKEVLKKIDVVQSKFDELVNSLEEMATSSELIFSSVHNMGKASDELIEAANIQRAASKVEFESIKEIFNKVNEMTELIQVQENDINEVGIVFNDLEKITDETISSVEKTIGDIKTVGAEVANLFSDISYFSVGGMVDKIRNVLRSAKGEIIDTIEKAIEDGIISMDDLFDRNYIPIPNTNPQKYKTRYDDFTDKYIRPIQDKYLQSNDKIVFLVLQDDKCYLPTHNSVYSKELTGDYEYDLANNRTKRIFDDPVGKACSENVEKEFLIQSYMRDNGDILFDVSTPLFIDNKHWGCIRCGFKL